MSNRLLKLPLTLTALTLMTLSGCQPAVTPTAGNLPKTNIASPQPNTPASGTPASTTPASTTPAAQLGNNDLGFRSEPDGFNFENGSAKPFKPKQPGSEYLTIKGMQTMFGDKNVCTGSTSGDKCVPTPSAKKWFEKINSGMNGGQCEGMAVLALSLYKGIDKPVDLEAGKTSTFDLSYGSRVRELVGYYFAYQYTDNVLNGTVRGTPKDVLNKLASYLSKDQPDPVTLGFYGSSGGHATTPYAIEDKGNGIYHIMMYDNNWPGKERFIEVDTKANTWIYNFAATNPTEATDAWHGDAKSKTLEFTPLSTRLKPASCPYCKDKEHTGSRQIFLSAGSSGNAHITVINKNNPNEKIGWDAASGQYVNTMSNAELGNQRTVLKAGDAPEAPMLEVPAGVDYEIKVDGKDLKAAEQVKVSVFGEGKSIEVSNIDLDPNQEDTLKLGADGDSMKYKPGNSPDKESPVIKLGYDDPNGLDYAVELKNLDATNGEELSTDFVDGKLKVGDDGGEADPYDLVVNRLNDDGSEVDFSKDNISLGAGETDNIEFSQWGGEGQGMLIGPDGNEVSEPDVDSEDDSATEPDF